MSMSKTSKLFQFLNYRMKITLQDGRTLVGKFMAFDRHMNLVVGDCEEYRTIVSKGKKEQQEQKRTLGLLLIRGETIVSMTVEGPPAAEDSRVKAILKQASSVPQQQQQPGIPTSGAARGVPVMSTGMMQPPVMPGRGMMVPPPQGVIPGMMPGTTAYARGTGFQPYPPPNVGRGQFAPPGLGRGHQQ